MIPVSKVDTFSSETEATVNELLPSPGPGYFLEIVSLVSKIVSGPMGVFHCSDGNRYVHGAIQTGESSNLNYKLDPNLPFNILQTLPSSGEVEYTVTYNIHPTGGN